MSAHPSSRLLLRMTWLSLEVTIVLYCWMNAHCQMVAAQLRNVTIDDTDPSIVYSPADAWNPHSENCTVSICLNPAVSNSYHEGLHMLLPDSGAFTSTSLTSQSTDAAPAYLQPRFGIITGGTEPGDDIGGIPQAVGPRDSKERRRRSSGVPIADIDDADLADAQVALHFNFTGSAVYVFGIRPPAASKSTISPTIINLSFTLDRIVYPIFLSAGTQGSTGVLRDIPVFRKKNLTEGPHALTVDVPFGSAFLFDYLVYTTAGLTNLNSTNTTSPSIRRASPPAASSPILKPHNNIPTFGAAVGGSVGVLALLTLCLAFSLIRRRRKSALRDRLERGSRPEIIGPLPFVERFFPLDPTDQTQMEATVSSKPQPTSGAALSSPTSGASTTFSGHVSPQPVHAISRASSYADTPPFSSSSSAPIMGSEAV